jgi:hypothetical protein
MAQFPNGASATQTEIWLTFRGVDQRIAADILPVLQQMWLAALEAGVQAGSQSAGVQAQVSQQEYQDIIAQFKRNWLPQIVTTTIRLIAGALVSGALTAAALVAAIAAALEAINRARQIAITEITRAMALMAQRIYHSAGHTHVRWITEHDTKVCALCEANEAAGIWPLGVPFPTGAPYPPQHPGCRCAIVPA